MYLILVDAQNQSVHPIEKQSEILLFVFYYFLGLTACITDVSDDFTMRFL